uniref:12 kDa protein n=1 Tax=Babesia gibsoni TaxID=33632 RepID=D5IGH5_BABGI|nr:12 kDa protein [Babesia gibsoni]
MKLHRLPYLVSSWTLLLSLPIPFAQAGGGGAGLSGSTGSVGGTRSPGGSQPDVRGTGGTGTGNTQTDAAKVYSDIIKQITCRGRPPLVKLSLRRIKKRRPILKPRKLKIRVKRTPSLYSHCS